MTVGDLVNIDVLVEFFGHPERQRVAARNSQHVVEMIHGVVIAEARRQRLDV